MAKHPNLSLRTLLSLDAFTCALMGLFLITLTVPVADLTHIAPTLLFWGGVLLIPTAVFMAFFARSPVVPGWAVTVTVYGNVGWVFLSLALPILGVIHPTVLGWVFLVGQSAVVAVFARLEHVAARQEMLPA